MLNGNGRVGYGTYVFVACCMPCVYTCVCIYIYMWIEREREGVGSIPHKKEKLNVDIVKGS